MTGILIARILLWLVLPPVGPIVGQTPERVRDDSVSTRENRMSAETPVAENPPVLERDTFTYVTTQRRDPFLPVPITRLPEENVPWKPRYSASSTTSIPGGASWCSGSCGKGWAKGGPGTGRVVVGRAAPIG